MFVFSVNKINCNPLTISNSDDDESLENYVIPGVLTQANVGKVPTYRLSLEDIESSSEGAGNFVPRVIHQASNSVHTCILYVPRIDQLPEDIRELMVENFNVLRGKPVLLMCTSSSPLATLDAKIKRIFLPSRRHTALNSSEEERKEFFRPAICLVSDVLGGNSTNKGVRKKGQEQINTLSQSLICSTENQSLDFIVSLHDRLIVHAVKYKNLVGKGDKIFDALKLVITTHKLE